MRKNKSLNEYGQYKSDLFIKLSFEFLPGMALLDVGCGDGSDTEIFKNYYKLKVDSCDIYKDDKIDDQKVNFKLGSALDLPYKADSYDYVFLHDVLHHIDEKNQDEHLHLQSLREVRRVLKNKGWVVVVEGNRYNPLFYPHMVKMRGHNHFKQGYFMDLFKKEFENPKFKFFEAHYYPHNLVKIFKVYEYMMEKFMPKSILSYNVAIVQVNK